MNYKNLFSSIQSMVGKMFSIVSIVAKSLISLRRNVFMGILSGNPQNEPMHYGEVFGIWSYLAAAQGTIAG